MEKRVAAQPHKGLLYQVQQRKRAGTGGTVFEFFRYSCDTREEKSFILQRLNNNFFRYSSPGNAVHLARFPGDCTACPSMEACQVQLSNGARAFLNWRDGAARRYGLPPYCLVTRSFVVRAAPMAATSSARRAPAT
jgi:hypothetical protein